MYVAKAGMLVSRHCRHLMLVSASAELVCLSCSFYCDFDARLLWARHVWAMFSLFSIVLAYVLVAKVVHNKSNVWPDETYRNRTEDIIRKRHPNNKPEEERQASTFHLWNAGLHVLCSKAIYHVHQ